MNKLTIGKWIFSWSFKVEKKIVTWIVLYKLLCKRTTKDYYLDVRTLELEQKIKPSHEDAEKIIRHNLSEEETYYDIIIIIRKQ
jgi:hypothetical protein